LACSIVLPTTAATIRINTPKKMNTIMRDFRKGKLRLALLRMDNDQQLISLLANCILRPASCTLQPGPSTQHPVTCSPSSFAAPL
jgi:hypothetical protein